MPKLLAFIVCEKVILEKQFETPTLVSVMQRVMFQAPAPAPNTEGPAIPANALAPLRWAIFSMWTAEESEIGQSFRQKCDLLMPDGTTGSLLNIDLPFTVKDLSIINVGTATGFPIGQLGTLNLRMWIETDGGDMVTPRYIYPIKVEQTAAVPGQI